MFNRTGGFRHSSATTFNMSDHDFLLRVGCEGPAILIESPSTVAYRSHSSNSVRDTRRVVAGMLRIIRAEREGRYPGGRSRRFHRYASIGGPALHWSKRAMQRGHPLLAIRLFMSAFSMILAKALRRGCILLHGVKPVTSLPEQ